MKLTLSFLSSYFATWSKNQDKNLNILWAKRAFDLKKKAFFIIFKGLLAAKKRLKPESAPLKVLFVLKIFKFLSWFFAYVEKMAWLERLD